MNRCVASRFAACSCGIIITVRYFLLDRKKIYVIIEPVCCKPICGLLLWYNNYSTVFFARSQKIYIIIQPIYERNNQNGRYRNKTRNAKRHIRLKQNVVSGSKGSQRCAPGPFQTRRQKNTQTSTCAKFLTTKTSDFRCGMGRRGYGLRLLYSQRS